MSLIDFVGSVATVVLVLQGVVFTVLWIRGIFPVLYRLGNGLARRKIALFAKGDSLASLRSLLEHSTLFRAGNVLPITRDGDMGIATRATLFLVYWPDWKDSLPAILEHKADGVALIVYAPQEHGLLPPEAIALLDTHRNVVLNNFRGRLLNDIVASMITTSYE